MTDRELLDEVRRMRAVNAPPKVIARALGVRQEVIAPLVRQVAAEATTPHVGELAGCGSARPGVASCWSSGGRGGMTSMSAPLASSWR